MKDWPRDRDVGQMRSAAIVRIVDQESLARAQFLFRETRDHVLDGADQRTKMQRRDRRERQKSALRVENSGRTVAPLLDVRRVGRLHQRRHHFFAGRAQAMRNHLRGDGVHLPEQQVQLVQLRLP